MHTQPKITVIIPTSCTTKRAKLLLRAISSIHKAGPSIVKIIIAANGSHIDPDLALGLQARQDLHYIWFEEGSLPKTISLAIALIDTEYFGFLDDDDELLPRSLIHRLVTLQQTPTADLVISNGYLRKSGEDSLYLNFINQVPDDPLGSFFRENWLPSCGALFRTSSIGPEYFRDYHPYAEWSWLAFRLAMNGKRICVLNEPTFRIHADTPSSLSKSAEYRQCYVSLYRKMLDMNPPLRIRRILQRRLSQAHHDVSDWLLSEGRVGAAALHFLFSLRSRSGWRFLPYSRYIVSAAFRKIISQKS